MSPDSSDQLQPASGSVCTECGVPFPCHRPDCSLADGEGHELPKFITHKLERIPTTILKAQSAQTKFETGATILFQVLPSGMCISVHVKRPLMLGRRDALGTPPQFHLVDLSEHQAVEHGVSRRHCRVQRIQNKLFLADVGSTNGTYLNGKRLVPFEDHVIGDGDKLILGTLHLSIFFNEPVSTV